MPTVWLLIGIAKTKRACATDAEWVYTRSAWCPLSDKAQVSGWEEPQWLRTRLGSLSAGADVPNVQHVAQETKSTTDQWSTSTQASGTVDVHITAFLSWNTGFIVPTSYFCVNTIISMNDSRQLPDNISK